MQDHTIECVGGTDGFIVTSAGFSLRLSIPEVIVEEGVLSDNTRVSCRVDDCGRGLMAQLGWEVNGRAYQGRIILEKCQSGVRWQMHVKPDDGQTWRLMGTSEGSGELHGWSDSDEVRLFHADNVRGVTQVTSFMEGAFMLPLSRWKRPLNAGRWQGFPGLWLTESGHGFVCGVLSQEVWKHTVFGEKVSPSCLRLQGNMSAPGLDAKSYGEGESYESEPLYFEWVEEERPSRAFTGYLNALSDRLSPCKEHSILCRSISWGSWNDRRPHFWDVSEELLARTAEVVKARFPEVKTLQIDDGYADGGFYESVLSYWSKLEHGLNPEEHIVERRPRRLGAAFMHEPGHAISAERFPHGMNAVRDLIARDGFMPAIWLGLNIVYDAKLAKDHPEWLTYSQPSTEADPELLQVFGETAVQGARVLDPSLPEVQQYLEDTADVLFKAWGFGSLKLDFWSYAFENDSFRLKRDEKTAFELRRWLFDMLRARLAPEGFLTIGCDISTGNPFMCNSVDNIRYGTDIGNGRWDNVCSVAHVGTFMLHVEAYRFYILNSDSAGLLECLPENEQRAFLAWIASTRSLCEVSGDLAVQSHDKLRPLQKLLLAPKNGEPAFVGETEHLEANEPASVVWSKGDLFSTVDGSQHIPDAVLGVFNWSDDVRTICISRQEFGIADGQVADIEFWGDTCDMRCEDQWEITLEPHSARLSHLSALSTLPRVLASSWQVNDTAWEDEEWRLELRGDSPDGMIFYWPYDAKPQLSASLPFGISLVGDRLYRVQPELAEDELQNWKIRISTQGGSTLPYKGFMEANARV